VTASALERLLGRELPASERGSVSTLNDLPHERLQEAAALAARARLAAVEYLLFYVGNAELDHASDFVDDVLLGGADPRSWGISDVLFAPGTKLVNALQIDVPTVLQPLEVIVGERWWRVAPERELWDWSGLCGAPGVLVRRAPYVWSAEAARLGVGGHALYDEPLEQVHDLAIAMRRWMASRVAWQLAQQGVTLAADATVSDVMTALSADVPCSADAEIAIRGLLREERELGPASDAVPGFRGPDEWYAA
jgi:hypothetical protein